MATWNREQPTYPEYAVLRALADRRGGRFVDPLDVHSRIPNLINRRGYDWALAVLGREYRGVGSLYGSDTELLKIADERDLTPPLPQWVHDARAAAAERERRRAEQLAAARQRDVDAWEAVLRQMRVEVDVYTNTTARVRLGNMEYLAHAVPSVRDAYSGVRKIRTHPVGRALCESENRARPLSLSHPPEPDGVPVTCVRCLAWAVKVRSSVG
jgi:hypothetical protein